MFPLPPKLTMAAWLTSEIWRHESSCPEQSVWSILHWGASISRFVCSSRCLLLFAGSALFFLFLLNPHLQINSTQEAFGLHPFFFVHSLFSVPLSNQKCIFQLRSSLPLFWSRPVVRYWAREVSPERQLIMVEMSQAELAHFQLIHSLQVFLEALFQIRIGMDREIVVHVCRSLDQMEIVLRQWSATLFFAFWKSTKYGT